MPRHSDPPARLAPDPVADELAALAAMQASPPVAREGSRAAPPDVGDPDPTQIGGPRDATRSPELPPLGPVEPASPLPPTETAPSVGTPPRSQ